MWTLRAIYKHQLRHEVPLLQHGQLDSGGKHFLCLEPTAHACYTEITGNQSACMHIPEPIMHEASFRKLLYWSLPSPLLLSEETIRLLPCNIQLTARWPRLYILPYIIRDHISILPRVRHRGPPVRNHRSDRFRANRPDRCDPPSVCQETVRYTGDILLHLIYK